MEKRMWKFIKRSSVILVMIVYSTKTVLAQCAMCTLNAENSVQNGNTQGMGLNDGILFLLAMPYLIAVGVGILWYRKYRRRNHTHIHSKHDSIHLN